MMMSSRSVRILPLLVLVASLSLIIRVGDMAMGVQQSGVAFAQQEVDVDVPAMPDDLAVGVHDDEAHEEGEDMAEAPMGDDKVSPNMAGPFPEEQGEKIEWKDATESEFDYSEVRADLYKDLSARREALEGRERSLATREALLEAAERELDQKLREMTAVRNEIEGLLQQQSEEEQERINSLVRIYEGMKAKDAARIFNTLDIDVLLSVMSRMSERKSAPILAEMSPERARAVTILLAQQKQIPSIPPQ